ncbi:MAG TPA: biotin transporter BioY [Solirubrobacterales bacterium]|nr:biotin transporter BioY [Solirubrobacterales bacterium]
MSTLSNTVEAPRVPVLADLFANTWVLNAVLVLGGALFTALCAQIVIPMTPVPMTGQTLAVMLVGAALGWKRGMAALTLYMVLGFVLPFYAEGGSGIENITQIGSVAGATGGYIIGFIFAAGAVGWLAERGSDRKILTAFASFVVGQLIIFAFGLAGLKLAAPELVELGFMSSSSWSTVVHDGFTIFIVGGLVKAAIGAILMPAAWKLAERTR